jgi:hypothetical protein
MENQPSANDDYDTPWKDAITRYFPEFMAFYFPSAHAEIDWQQAHVFLDQELAQIVQDAELGKRLVDRLVQVSDARRRRTMGLHPRRSPGPARRQFSRTPLHLQLPAL